MSLLLFPAYKLSRKDTEPENICDIVFEKVKCCGGTVNRTSFYGEAAFRKVLQKKCYEKFHGIHKKISVPESLFLCFLVNFAKFVKTPFLKNSTRRDLLIIELSIVAKGVFVGFFCSFYFTLALQ